MIVTEESPSNKTSLIEELAATPLRKREAIVMVHTSDRTEQLVLLTVATDYGKLVKIQTDADEKKKEIVIQLAAKLEQLIPKNAICKTIVNLCGGRYISPSVIRSALGQKYKDASRSENAKTRWNHAKFATKPVQKDERRNYIEDLKEGKYGDSVEVINDDYLFKQKLISISIPQRYLCRIFGFGKPVKEDETFQVWFTFNGEPVNFSTFKTPSNGD